MDERPLWELKAIAFLLAASAGLATIFGVITRELFNTIFLAVVAYFMTNASGHVIGKIMEKLLNLRRSISIYSIDWAIKIVFIGFSILTVIFFYLGLVDYDTTIKVLQAIIVLLMANFGWLEYKLSKL
jgi:hypothetical protein